MTGRRLGAAVLTAIAWLVALAIGFLLWRHASWLRYYLFCWPTNTIARQWHAELTLTYGLIVLDLILPAAATLCIRHRPGIAAILAAIHIVLIPIAFAALWRWNSGVSY
jgi:hypothetical protein